MRRTGVLTVGLVVLGAVSVACGAGPSVHPEVAVVQDAEGRAAPAAEDAAAPELPAPTKEPDWRDCTADTLTARNLPPGPAGLILECAQIPAAIDASGAVPGSFPLDVVRARLANTPADAAPLVLTTGSDLPSTQALAAVSTGSLAGIVAARPVVAVDRRGLGASQPIECIAGGDRRALADLGQFGRTGDGPDRVAELGRQATIACTDYLQPQELLFDAAHAADDLEQLRTTWGVERIGVLGIGNGATVALAYASKYPTTLGRLVLDSPAAATADAELLAESRARGAEAAVDAFARQCVALQCSLGADPRAALEDLHARAAAGTLAPLSSNALLTALSGFLGSPRGDGQARVRQLADALSAAAAGDVTPVLELVGPAEAALLSDGQFVARCTDGQRWPTTTRAAELQRTWAANYPLFGGDAATGLTACGAWPSVPTPPLPAEVRVPVLVTTGAADPLVGSAGLESVTGALTAVSARWAALSWQGAGFSAALHSGCAQARVVAYLDTGELPPNGSLCPA